jgi:two-component system chemotaxis response regulator CheB
MARILIAEDDGTSALLLERTLLKAGHDVRRAGNGLEALEMALHESFDALLTDWMMPGKDGIQLIRDLRRQLPTMPLTMVITALSSAEAKQQALEAGADAYLAKPYRPADVTELLDTLFARQAQGDDEPEAPPLVPQPARRGKIPEHLAVCIAASTGGPGALRTLFSALPPQPQAAFFVVLHGPEWMIQSFATSLAAVASMPVRLGEDRLTVMPGTLYLAPGNRHMYVDPKEHDLRLSDAPPINHVKPAADPLLQSVALVYRECSLGLILTGLGRDGTRGVQQIHRYGGRVLVQDPEASTAPAMPASAVESGVADAVLALPALPQAVAEEIARLLPRLPAPQTSL